MFLFFGGKLQEDVFALGVIESIAVVGEESESLQLHLHRQSQSIDFANVGFQLSLDLTPRRKNVLQSFIIEV